MIDTTVAYVRRQRLAYKYSAGVPRADLADQARLLHRRLGPLIDELIALRGELEPIAAGHRPGEV